MKHTTTFFIATLIAATVLINTSTVLAQEWRVLLGQGIFQTDQFSQDMKKTVVQPNDWLATQTPLWKDTPITSVGQTPRPVAGNTFDSEYSQVGSWAPLPGPTGKESFTLFSF
jgi:hypothetical protein